MKIAYLALILASLSPHYAKADFSPKQLIQLDHYSDHLGVSGKSRIRIHFLIDTKADFAKLGIKGIDLCRDLEHCERINGLATGPLLKDGDITFGHALTESGDKGLYLHLQTATPKILNPLITLNSPIVLEKDFGYEAFIKLTKMATGDYQAEFMAYGPHHLSEERIMLYEPDKAYRVSLKAGFEVAIPKGATGQPMVLGFSADGRNGRNDGALHISPEIEFNLPITISAKFDFQLKRFHPYKVNPDKTLTDLDDTPTTINDYNMYNTFGENPSHEAMAPEYVGIDADGAVVYLIRTTRSGVFFIDEKDPFEGMYLNAPALSTVNTALTTDACVAKLNQAGNS